MEEKVSYIFSPLNDSSAAKEDNAHENSSNRHEVNNNFIIGIENARNILEELKRSIRKTSKYEKSLLHCMFTHSHTHCKIWIDSKSSVNSKYSKNDNNTTSFSRLPRSEMNMSESWSTMSIVCLQYQYEELSKKYEALLRAYDEQRAVAKDRDAALYEAQHNARQAFEESTLTHVSLLKIGNKYLELKDRKNAQKAQYEERISQLQKALYSAARAARRAHTQLDSYLSQHLHIERDSARALLLTEIRRCNLLSLENLKLKTRIENLSQASLKRDY